MAVTDTDWTQQDYQTLRDSIVIDGVAYSRQRLREILRERHVLAEESLRLRQEAWEHALGNGGCVPGAAYRDLAEEHKRLGLEQKELREKLRRNAVHLQRRTAALTRLVARKAL